MNRRMFLGSVVSTLALGCGPRSVRLETGTGANESLQIVFFTDVHTTGSAEITGALVDTGKAINRLSADLVIAGGDFINEGIQSCRAETLPRWELYRHLQSELRGPVEAVIGNHDLVAVKPEGKCEVSADPRAEFRSFFGLPRTYRTFVANGYRIFVLDSIAIRDDEIPYVAEISAEQLTWLKSELSSVGDNEPLIVVSHVPLMTSYFEKFEPAGFRIPRSLLVQNAKEVLEIFDRKNLVAVLQGHLHINEILRWRNTTFITGGAVCGGWWNGPWHGTPAGFGVITLRQNDVEWKYIPTNFGAAV